MRIHHPFQNLFWWFDVYWGTEFWLLTHGHKREEGVSSSQQGRQRQWLASSPRWGALFSFWRVCCIFSFARKVRAEMSFPGVTPNCSSVLTAILNLQSSGGIRGIYKFMPSAGISKRLAKRPQQRKACRVLGIRCNSGRSPAAP